MDINKSPIMIYEKTYANAKNEFDKKLLEAKRILKKEQKKCKHKFTFYPDPSGNNDSESVCDFCGFIVY